MMRTPRANRKAIHLAMFAGLTLGLFSLVGCGTQPPTGTPSTQTTQPARQPHIANPKPILATKITGTLTVMGVGGSVAHGWDDKVGGGYLVRAFKTLTAEGPIHYNFVNKSIEGDGPTQMAPKYLPFLRTVKPQVVVISWGMLDDISNKTPIAKFKQAIHDEISQALQAGCYVMVVTPPVTGASYAHDVTSEANLVNTEIGVAQDFHSNKVYVFDLFNQMKAYLSEHHQSVSKYSADAWHPNTAGHTLAGQLLANDIEQGFAGKTEATSK